MMQLLSAEEAKEWCEARGLVVRTDYPFAIRFADADAWAIRVAVPGDALRVVALAYLLLGAEAPDFAEEAFSGGLAWMRDWEIWSESTDRVGHALLRGLRASDARAADLYGLPAHRFDAAERTEAQAMLILPLLFQWDAWFIPESAALVAFVSHDGWIGIAAASSEVRDRLMEGIRAGGWSLLPDAPDHAPAERSG